MSTTTFEQIVDVSGYKPTGLTALVVWYTRNFDADVDDFSVATISALDSADVLIGSATTSANVVGPTTTWRRAELTKTLPAGTAKVKVTIALSGANPPDAGVAGISLQVGQMSAELVANGSFTNGTFTSWTNVSNSFAAYTTSEYASDATTIRAAQGGAFASSEIKQEIAIPAGYTYGDAVLTLARSSAISDLGTVTLEVLNGGGSVIATATTGAETIAAGWERRKLVVTLPNASVTLRIRLIAARSLGAGNSGALFDDVSLRIHKDLDPAYALELDFSEPQRQVMPRTWQEAYLAWPELELAHVWNGSSLLPTAPQSQTNGGASAAWSDASSPTPAKFLGHWTHDEAANSVDAYRFTRAVAGSAVDIEVTGYGAFQKTDVFSVAVCFRVTELAMTLACGLVGNRDGSGIGWGLSLDTSGRVVAGVTGTTPRTATGAVDHRDGAAHWVLLTWNGTTLRVVDGAGTATNASDPGEFSSSAPMRIGRDGPLSATGGIDIARVLLWDGTAISQSELQSTIDRIGDDPNGRVAWTSSQPVWVDGEDDADGVTLVRAAASHLPLAYSQALASYGLSTGTAGTNRVVSTDYVTGTSIETQVDATLTTGTVDPTGLKRGATIVNTTVDRGIRFTDMPLDAANVRVVFWARTNDGSSQNVQCEILDAVDNIEDADVHVVTDNWKRFEQLSAWSGPTPTGTVRFSIIDNVGTFDLAGVMWVGHGAAPTAYQDPSAAVGDRHGTVIEAMPVQLNHEGEIEAVAVAGVSGVAHTLVSIDNNVNANGQRLLGVNASDLPVMTLWDDSGSPTSVAAVGSGWSVERSLRARWNTLELPESLGKQIAITESDVVEGSGVLAFSTGTSGLSRVRLGGGFGSATSAHALLQRIAIRARETKLP